MLNLVSKVILPFFCYLGCYLGKFCQTFLCYSSSVFRTVFVNCTQCFGYTNRSYKLNTIIDYIRSYGEGRYIFKCYITH